MFPPVATCLVGVVESNPRIDEMQSFVAIRVAFVSASVAPVVAKTETQKEGEDWQQK